PGAEELSQLQMSFVIIRRDPNRVFKAPLSFVHLAPGSEGRAEVVMRRWKLMVNTESGAELADRAFRIAQLLESNAEIIVRVPQPGIQAQRSRKMLAGFGPVAVRGKSRTVCGVGVGG